MMFVRSLIIIIICILVNPLSYASDTRYCKSKAITQYKKAWNIAKTSYKAAHWELPITKDEKHSLQKLIIPKSRFLRIVDLSDLNYVENKVYEFIAKENDDFTSTNIAKTIIRLVKIISTTNTTNNKHSVLRVSLFNPKDHDNYEIPRYHFDLGKDGNKFRNIITLKGSSTKFLECKEDFYYTEILKYITDVIPDLYENSVIFNKIDPRTKVSNKIEEYINHSYCKNVVKPNNFVSTFSTHMPNPNIHSDPFMDSPRLVVIVSSM